MKLKDLFFCLFYTTIVVSLCLCFDNYFFLTDDALSEMIGFYTQYGKVWTEGNIPFIVDSMYVGSNAMIELGKGVFSPQSIITSIIAYKTNPVVASIFISFWNIFLVTLGGVLIAKKLKIKTVYSYSFAMFLAIQPVFLYEYTGAWWNAANGQSWAIVSIATLLMLKDKFSPCNVLVNFFSVVFMLSSGWPHGVIGYVVILFAIFLYVFFIEKKRSYALMILIPSLISLFFSFPIYSEYIFSRELVSRVSGLNNFNNLLVPSWKSIFLTFNPTSYDFMNYFLGYSIIWVPIAFSSVFFAYSIFSRDVRELIIKDKLFSLLLVVSVVFFILTQTPSQFLQTRWPYRFLPFLSLFLSLFTFYLLDKGSIKKLGVSYYAVIVLSFFVSISTSAGENVKYFYLNLISFLFLLVIPSFFSKITFLKLFFSVIFSLLVMLNGSKHIHWFSEDFKLPDTLVIPNDEINNGFLLSTIEPHLGSNKINRLTGSQAGIYGISTLGGYSPVGNKILNEVLPSRPPHSIYNATILNSILEDSEIPNLCFSHILQVRSIIIYKDRYNEYRDKLLECGYSKVVEIADNEILVQIPLSDKFMWESMAPVIYPTSNSFKHIKHTNNMDILEIDNLEKETVFIFPRIWWHGYTAKLNDKSIPVMTDRTGLLVKIILPKGESGMLKLSYYPSTWSSYYLLSLFSFFALILLIIFSYKWVRK